MVSLQDFSIKMLDTTINFRVYLLDFYESGEPLIERSEYRPFCDKKELS